MTQSLKNPLVIHGYPKSGNTWIGFILSYYYNVVYLDAHQQLPKEDSTSGANPLDEKGQPKNHFLGGHLRTDQEKSCFTSIIKTHRSFDDFQQHHPDIYARISANNLPILIVREPKDVAVSYYFYKYFHLPLMLGYRTGKLSLYLRLVVRRMIYFENFVLNVAEEWRDYHEKWLQIPHYLIKYEQLSLDPVGTVYDLIMKLDGKVNEKYLQEAVTYCHFNNLKKMERKELRVESRHQSFFREGKVNGWTKHFSGGLRRIFDARLGSVYGKLGYGEDQAQPAKEVVISIENLCKEYRLGTIGTGMLFRDLQSWLARIRGLPDPNIRMATSMTSIHEKNNENQRFWALKNINLQVKKGEVVGIIGRNGAGKSTLLKILSQVTNPTLGRVRIKGRVVSLLEVGTGFHPELTGRENIYLNGAILGMSQNEIREKFAEIIAFAEIEAFIDTPVKRYSSGMYMRLAFAVAAHLDPEILIVDEVLAVGDMRFQNKCLGKMKDVSSKDGRTVLFVSHNMSSIYSLCNRVVRLENKKIIADGTPEQVIPKYLESQAVRTVQSAFKEQSNNGYTLQRLEILDDGQETAFLNVGSCVEFILHFTAPRLTRVAGVSVKLASIVSESHLLLCSDPDYGYAMEIAEGKNRVSAKIPRLHLTSGKYTVSVYFSIPHMESLARFESIQEIEVVSGDLYNSGFSVWMNRSAYFEECEWSHEASGPSSLENTAVSLNGKATSSNAV